MSEFDCALYQGVADGLNKRESTITYEGAVNVLAYASSNYKHHETIDFLDQFLLKIVNILGAQNSVTIAPQNCTHVKNALNNAFLVILNTFPQYPMRYCDALFVILSSKCNFYTASANLSHGYHQGLGYINSRSARETVGANEVRLRLVHRFVREGLLSSILEHMQQYASHSVIDAVTEGQGWIGTKNAAVLVEVLGDSSANIPMVDKLASLYIIMDVIGVTFNETKLKTESTDELKNLFDAMYNCFPIVFDKGGNEPLPEAEPSDIHCSGTDSSLTTSSDSKPEENKEVAEFQEKFQQFWLSNTLKLLKCKSIVLRLFGWEQVQEILRIAVTTRPLAASYVVSNAAESHINGVYEFAGLGLDYSPKYEKHPCGREKSSESDFEEVGENENGTKITLFRCNIGEKGEKWWYLSKADEMHPGTNKDIDYYHRKLETKSHDLLSQMSNDREPPCFGWTLPHTSPSCEPLPIVKRKGILISKNGQLVPQTDEVDRSFIAKLLVWVHEHQVISSVIDLSCLHREVITRSNMLLLLLTEMDHIVAEDIKVMWLGGLESPDSDCVDEIFDILARMSPLLSDEMYENVLINGCIVDELNTQLHVYYSSLSGTSGSMRANSSSSSLSYYGTGSNNSSPGEVSKSNATTNRSSLAATSATSTSSGMTGSVSNKLKSNAAREAALVSSTHALNRIMLLLEKLFKKSMTDLSTKKVSILFGAVWVAFKLPIFDTLKLKSCIESLFSRCLEPYPFFTRGKRCGVAAPYMVNQTNSAAHMKYKTKYINQKDSLLSSILYECGSVLRNSDDHVSAVKEVNMSRTMRIIQYLLEHHITPQVVHAVQYQEKSLSSILLDEIVRYVSTNRVNVSPSATSGESDWYHTELILRLDVLRSYYYASEDISMSRSEVKQLWDLLHSEIEVEMNVLFEFLKRYPSTVENATSTRAPADLDEDYVDTYVDALRSVYGTQADSDAFYIYRLLCSPGVDFSACGSQAFDCFRVYFDEFETCETLFPDETGTSGTSLQSSMGFDTLWKMLFTIGCEDTAKNIMCFILTRYNNIGRDRVRRVPIVESDMGPFRVPVPAPYRVNPTELLLDRLFGELMRMTTHHNASTLQTKEARGTSRAIATLYEALSHSRRSKDHSCKTAHLGNGTMSRIHIVVHYREVNGMYFNIQHRNGPGSIHHVIKGSEGVAHLNMHPLETLGDLKRELGKITKFIKYDRVLLEHSLDILKGDSTTLLSHGLVDDSTIDATSISIGKYSSGPARYSDRFNSMHNVNHAVGRPVVHGPPGSTQGSLNVSTVERSMNESLELELDNICCTYDYLTGISEAIVSNNSRFECILSLFKVLEGVDNSIGRNSINASMQMLWSLLMQIPTQPRVLSSILSPLGISGTIFDPQLETRIIPEQLTVSFYYQSLLDMLQPSNEEAMNAVDWDQILGLQTLSAIDVSSVFASAYVLQTIDYLLQPSAALFTVEPTIINSNNGRNVAHHSRPPLPPEKSEINSCQLRQLASTLFQHRFVESGGFEYLLKLFTSGSVATALVEECVYPIVCEAYHCMQATILHIINHLLHDRKNEAHKRNQSRTYKPVSHHHEKNLSRELDMDGDDASSENSISFDDDQDSLDCTLDSMKCTVAKLQESRLDGIVGLIEAMDGCGRGDVTIVSIVLQVASTAASSANFDIVQDALNTLTFLLKLDNMASHLLDNHLSVEMLKKIFLSESKKIRTAACEFVVCLGRSPRALSIVIKWLLGIVESGTAENDHCVPELFGALKSLLMQSDFSSHSKSEKKTARVNANDLALISQERSSLAEIIASRLLCVQSSPSGPVPLQFNQEILLGYLELLHCLIVMDVGCLEASQLGVNSTLIQVILGKCLFPLPEAGKNCMTPLCQTVETRHTASLVLLAYFEAVSKRSDQQRSTTELYDNLKEMFDYTGTITGEIVSVLHFQWGMEFSSEMKDSVAQYTGLKNQGCTCYLNSLLQQLFMDKTFREVILRTPLLECHRNYVWHYDDEQLRGLPLLIHQSSGEWRLGRVSSYNSVSKLHMVEYVSVDTSTGDEEPLLVVKEVKEFNIRLGSFGCETGQVRVLASFSDDIVPLTPQEESAYAVLEQMQRAFMFMLLSKRRYFDPKPLVEACKSLNLTFNVFQQNDASEFCDQLLDRLETAMQGKHSGVDMWNDVLMKSVFGGKTMAQKIPRSCQVYSNENKNHCGQWLGCREETFINIELIIRGKEAIDDSFKDMVRGELMDGDNKLMCDTCNEKKAVTRRQCLSVLPNLFILHLKRFDLDFTTFETVKLNNKIEFGTSLNMLSYTQQGLDMLEGRSQSCQNKSGVSVTEDIDSNQCSTTRKHVTLNDAPGSGSEEDGVSKMEEDSILDPMDFEYQLQGVLVHMGIAQGGHYYSFIRDCDDYSTNSDSPKGSSKSLFSCNRIEKTADGAAHLNHPDAFDGSNDCKGYAVSHKWYRFDDDEVTNFNPKHIPVQCFGGSVQGGENQKFGIEEERCSNALMLFYSKVNTDSSRTIELIDKVIAKASAKKVQEGIGNAECQHHRVIDGYEAFSNEVMKANHQDMCLSHALDPELHHIVRDLMGVFGKNPDKSVDNIRTVLTAIQFSCHMLFDVMLHSRERNATQYWLDNLMCLITQSYRLDCQNNGAIWFLYSLLQVDANELGLGGTWLEDYLLYCTDSMARNAFMQILIHCLSVLGTDKKCLDEAELLVLPSANSPHSSLKVDGVYKVHPIIIQLFHKLSNCLVTAFCVLKNADDLLVTFKEIALCDDIYRCLLLEMDIIPLLGFYVLPDKSSAEVVAKFSRVVINKATRIELQMLSRDVYEAIAAIIGVGQMKKCRLLQENVKGSQDEHVGKVQERWTEPALTAAAKRAFTIIYEEVCPRNGFMDVRCFMNYLDRVLYVGASRASGAQVRQLFDRYEPGGSNGFLSLEGFLKYYRSVAMMNPKAAWRDLHYFGFENDLSRNYGVVSSTDIEKTNALFVNGSSNPYPDSDIDPNLAQNATSGPSGNIKLPVTTCGLLQQYAFYEQGLVFAEHAATAIAKKVCQTDVSYAKKLISYMCEKVYHLYGNDEDEEVEPIVQFLSNIVVNFDSNAYSTENCVSVSHLEIRLEELFFSDYGFVRLCVEENVDPDVTLKCNAHQPRALVKKYFKVLQEFCGSMLFMNLYLQSKVQQMVSQQKVFDEYLLEEGIKSTDEQFKQELLNNRQFVHSVSSVYLAVASSISGESSEPSTPANHKSPAVAPASSEIELDNEMRNMNGILNQSYLQSNNLGTSLQNFTIFVDGAGIEDINGVYEFYRIFDGAGSFIKHVETTRGSICYMIYRCSMQVSVHEQESHQWFISTPPAPSRPGSCIIPGTVDDIDYYSAPDVNGVEQSPSRSSKPFPTMYLEFMPPRDNWVCEEGVTGLAPSIVFIGSLTTSATNSTINTPQRFGTPNRGGGNAFSPASTGSLQRMLSGSTSGNSDMWQGGAFPPSRTHSGNSMSSATINIDDDRVGIALNSGASLFNNPEYDSDSHSEPERFHYSDDDLL